jgi:autotransporter-associated beta strand protein
MTYRRPSTRSTHRRIRVAVAALSLAGLAGAASAQTTWNGLTDDWFTAANWSSLATPLNAPGTLQNVTISGGVFDPVIGGNQTTAAGTNDLNVNRTLTINALNGSADSLVSYGFVVVGRDGATGTVVQNGGNVLTGQWTILGANGGTAFYTINSGALTTNLNAGSGNPGNFIVGDFGGTGTFTNAGGAVTATNELWVGQGTGTGTFVQNAGSVTVNRWLAVGRQGGNGTFKLNGGTVSVASIGDDEHVEIGSFANGQARFEMTGGTFTADGGAQVRVGWEDGDAQVVQSGGTFNANSDLRMSNWQGSTTTYEMSGGTMNVGGAAFIAERGTATFTLTGGAATWGAALVGYRSDGSGTVVVDGPAATLGVNGIFILGDGGSGAFQGADGNRQGRLEVKRGAVTVGDQFWVGTTTRGRGTAVVSGGSLSVARNFVVGAFDAPDNNYSQTGGAVTANSSVIVGTGGGGNSLSVTGGTFTMTGANTDNSPTDVSFFVAQGNTLTVGGTGVLNVPANANTQFRGTVNVSGGQLNIDRNFVDVFPTASVNVSGGVANLGNVVNLSFDAGTTAVNVSGGELAVDEAIWLGGGRNSSLNVSGGVARIGFATPFERGVRLISDSASVLLTGGVLETPRIYSGQFSGPAAAGNAVVRFDGGTLRYLPLPDGFSTGYSQSLVDGALSNVAIDNGGATIDVNGTDSAFVDAQLKAGSGTGGLTKTGTGTLRLNGANTYVGNTSINAGRLALGSGGSVSASAAILLGSGATFDTTAIVGGYAYAGRVGGNGTVDGSLSLAGTLAPGSSIGTLAVTGDLTLTGTYEAEGNGAGAGSFDLISVAGALNVNGATLAISTVAGGVSLDDPAYVIATYGSLAGTFAAVNGLPSGYQIDYAYNGNSIALTAVPEPAGLGTLLGLGGLLGRRRRAPR